MGSALLVVSLFMPWYRDAVFIITRGADDTATVSLIGGSAREFTAWEAFAALDLVLLALAIAAVRYRAAAALAVALIAFQLIDTPTAHALTLAAGAWLALAGALVALVARLRPRATPSA